MILIGAFADFVLLHVSLVAILADKHITDKPLWPAAVCHAGTGNAD